MAVDPSVPNYKWDMHKDLEELRKGFLWCVNNDTRVSKAKVQDLKRGVNNLKWLAEKIEDEEFKRLLERLHIAMLNMPENFMEIKKDRADLILERINHLIKLLG